MPRLAPAFAAACALALAPFVGAQQPATSPDVTVSPLAEGLWRLTILGNVNVVACVGPDGALLVDTGYANSAPALTAALAALGGKDVRLVINTHSHADHVGGNAAFAQRAQILAHANARARMASYYALPSTDVAGLPSVTFTDGLTLHFNGETIRVFTLGPAHTDGDIIVHFTRAGVVVMGDILLADTFPNADLRRGGQVNGLEHAFTTVLSTLPKDTKFVAGHGRDLTVDELRAYQEMIVATIGAVRQSIAAGKAPDAMVAEGILDRWARWSGPRGLSTSDWTLNVAQSLTGGPVPSICAPITEALVDEDAQAAAVLYRTLRREQPHRYDFGEGQLNALGYELLQRGRVDDAIAIFALNVEAYPEAFNTHDSLGEAYLAAGNRDRATASYKRSLELNPANSNAAEALQRLVAERK